MLAMGDLYYYGARGLPRDQGLALNYFNQAAHLGDPTGMCGAAAMYLKGEGTTMNVSKAVELYENATRNGTIRAYNGLGYLYFYGSQVPKNETKAFEYFQIAAQYETDGDSLFNAGYCCEHGVGTEKDLQRAIAYYVKAKKVGHFDSIRLLGVFLMEVSHFCCCFP
jgi:SEL1 protein